MLSHGVDRGPSYAASTGTDTVSVVWDAWDNAGEAQTAAIQAIMPAEGQEAFLRLLAGDAP